MVLLLDQYEYIPCCTTLQNISIMSPEGTFLITVSHPHCTVMRLKVERFTDNCFEVELFRNINQRAYTMQCMVWNTMQSSVLFMNRFKRYAYLRFLLPSRYLMQRPCPSRNQLKSNSQTVVYWGQIVPRNRIPRPKWRRRRIKRNNGIWHEFRHDVTVIGFVI